MPIQNHAVWGVTSGFPYGYVYAITQTGDGYLWIGTSRGLIRYDGLEFAFMREMQSHSLARFPVPAVARDSTDQLWVTDDVTHLFRYQGGRLAGPEPDSGLHRHRLAAITTNRSGSLLFASEQQGIIEYEQGERRVVLDPGRMPSWPTAVAQTSDGAYWIGTRDNGVFRVSVTRGVARVDPIAKMPGAKINCLLPISDSTLLVSTNQGLSTIHDGEVIVQSRAELHGTEMLALALGREGEVWIGADRRVFKAEAHEIARDGRIQTLDRLEAASVVTALFEDRDGNLWIGGPDTIERYRGDGFNTYPSAEGLPSTNCGAIYVDEQGSVWFAPWDGGLYRLSKDSVEQITAAGLGSDTVYSISGGRGEIWVARKYGGVSRLRSGSSVSEIRTYQQRDGLAPGAVYSSYLTHDGTMWVGTLNGGISRLRDNAWRTFTTRDGLPSNTISVITGNAEGEIFAGTPNGLAEFGGKGWINHTTRDGLPPGAVESLLPDRQGAIWIGTEKGIAFLQSGQIHVPLGAPDPLYGEILGIAENGAWLWISTRDHVLRVKRTALLEGAFHAGDYREFAVADGLASVEGVKRSRSVVTDNQGRIWFSLHRGISYLEPSAFSQPAFPVTIRLDGMLVDGKQAPARSGLRVAPGPRRLTFRYAGADVSKPEDVRYRYRLENVDQAWSEPTVAREVDYTNVPPGRFTFHVQARTSNGAWNGPEAAMRFEIEPAFWQNREYRLFGAAGVLLLAWSFYRRRLRQITATADLRYAERLAERTRIARELHDTLLQSFQGLMLRLQLVDDLLPEGKAKTQLEQALERADQAVAEGRSAVYDLRSTAMPQNDLADALRALGEELVTPESAAFHLLVEGARRDLRPIIRDELYRIASEAIRNAFSHAQAHHVETEIVNGARVFRLRIRDDGNGIPDDILKEGRSGHYGLAGMRERARQIGGKLEIWSRARAGTEIELSIPGSIAYGAAPGRHLFHLFRRK